MGLRALLAGALSLLLVPALVVGQQGPVVLSGSLRTAEGAPIAGARLSIAETGSALATALTVTRADGSFSASVVPGTYAITMFVSTLDATPTSLVDTTTYAIHVEGDTSVELVATPGRVVQTCVVSADGKPLPGAIATIVTASLGPRTRVAADSSGWLRLVLGPGESVLVFPPAASGRELAHWVRADELVPDGDGVAPAIVLETMPDPSPVTSDVTMLWRGSAPGRHLTITFVAEGYTDLEEPFVDKNRNGVCDDEPYLDLNGNGKFEDGELYVDTNGDGKRTSESFVDENGDGVCNRGERALFVRNAEDATRVLLGCPVFREFRERIDVAAAFVASAQAGSDYVGLTAPIERDTAFGSRFQSRNFIFKLDGDRASDVARALVPETSTVVALTYSLFGLGRESAGDVTTLFGSRVPQLDVVLVHELGHAIATLADEYYDYVRDTYDGPEPGALNVTSSPGLAALKWGRFVRSSTAVPTPDGEAVVGAFEGGLLHRTGIFRPSFSCLMRDLGIFCPVCADAMFNRFATLSQEGRPSTPTLLLPRPNASVSSSTLVAFAIEDYARVVSARPVLDGAPAGSSSTIVPFGSTLDVRGLSTGRHQVAMDVTYVDGSTDRTASVPIAVAPRAPSTPSLARARYGGGSIVFDGASGLIVPGAALFVDGVDRYPLETFGSGRVRTVRASLGSASGLRVSKRVRPRRPVTLVVINPDGGRTAPVALRR